MAPVRAPLALLLLLHKSGDLGIGLLQGLEGIREDLGKALSTGHGGSRVGGVGHNDLRETGCTWHALNNEGMYLQPCERQLHFQVSDGGNLGP